jgi:hypothetical protein
MSSSSLPLAKYVCIKCDFACNKKSNYTVHLKTRKHKKYHPFELNINSNLPKGGSFFLKPIQCAYCGKQYKSRSSVWYHNKKCNNLSALSSQKVDNDILTTLLAQTNKLIDENNKLRCTIADAIQNTNDICTTTPPTIVHNTTIHTNNYTETKTFNLNVFLNETCKDAMNLMDFVQSIKIQLSDLQTIGHDGYISGLTNIIVSNLNSLGETKRPLHCTDKKRETVYIKDEDKWDIGNSSSDKLKSLINHVSLKNIKMLPKLKDIHSDTETQSNVYQKILIETMGGCSEKILETNNNKIIKNVIREIGIDKQN